ncbi:CPBP family intramembrane glutamic endopeptidase [Staphylococcus warneri]|uniref:CPBP family intramembrane glutamic endopeptidase n=1 Tax=Staphylococcus warneri TaxID=1292 RepID=UPI0022E49933|nr:type II CAAX endopeptidase family protein [Staphylococcus warneri]
MVNYLKTISISILIIIIGTCLFYVGIETKFIADNINDIVTFILIPATVYVMYRIILKYLRSKDYIDNRYVEPKKMPFSIKVVVIFVFAGLSDGLSSIFETNNKSANQKLIEAKEQNIDIFTKLSSTAINAPVIEEIVFRGVLFIIFVAASGALYKNSNQQQRKLGLISFFIVSSVLFGYVHVAKAGDIEHILPYLVSGICYSLVFIWTRDVFITIGMHAIGNFFSAMSRYGYISELLIIDLIVAISLGFIVAIYVYRNAKVISDYFNILINETEEKIRRYIRRY